MAILYVVATPIGNLEDMTQRALRILKEVDFVLCEDTRHTLQLLNYFGLKKSLISYHQHSQLHKVDYIINLLRQGHNLALVSDAGTPAISDPGGVLVHEVVSRMGDSAQIVPIPGAAAVITLASVAGLPTDKFLFLGFLPLKKGRQALFKQIKGSDKTVIFYESPHRIIKTLEALTGLLEPERQIVVGRELTKKFETIYRGSAKEVLEKLQADQIRGEFVVAVGSKK